MKRTFLEFKKHPLRTILLFFFLFGVGFWLQKKPFFSPQETTSPELTALLNRANTVLQEHQLSTPFPESSRLQESTNISGIVNSPHQIRWPQGLFIKSRDHKDLPRQVAGLLMNEIEWPSSLSLQHLSPQITEGRRPGRKNEVFINYEIRIQGFTVPQSNLRVMLFETGPHHYQISFIDYAFHLPPPNVFSLQISKEEAILRAQFSENKYSSPWKVSKEWRFSEEEWKPTWKVQLQGSPQTHYIDARTGLLESVDTELGARREFLVRGLGNLPLSPEGSFSPLPLPSIQAATATSQIIAADEKGFLHTEVPLETLLFALKNEYVEVKDHRDRELTYDTDSAQQTQQILLNPQGLTEEAAMINAFTAITTAHNYVVGTLGFHSDILKTQLKAYVNIDTEDCNARYRNGHVVFFQESEDCRNTAYDTVIYHEYAHFVDDLFGGIKDRSLSEGMGDVLASFMTNQPLIGQELFKQNFGALRSVETPALYTELSDPDFQDFIQYRNGQSWSGFAWTARQSFIEKYGQTEGASLAEWLFLSPLQTNAHSIKSALAEVYARSAQGTELTLSPDYELLTRAAKAHGLVFRSTDQKF